jgi:hypothetical protein
MMNRKFLLLVSFLLFLAASAQAQNTLVSGTIKDATGQAFSGGTYRFDFYPSPINPNGPYFQNGTPFNVHASVSGNLDSTGSLTNVPVPDNSTITPSGSSWTVTLCPAATSKCFSTIVTITGASQSISSIVPPPIVVSLNNPPPGGVSAYTDAEIVGAKLGSQYFNITDSTMHVCTSFSGSCTWTQNAAIKPAVSNAIEYVTTTGNDANDGLSWGSAKATIQAAVNALPLTPDGSTSGIVYVAAGTYTFSTGIVLPASHLHDSISIIGVPGYGTEAPSESVQGGTILNYTGSGAAISQVVASFANEADLAGSIRDIVINGANATGSAIGIKFGGMLNMDIRNVSIANFSGAGQIGIQVDNISTGGAVFTERYHFPNVSFENDNIGLQFKTESGGGASFAHSSGNIIYFDLYNGQTGISVVGGAVVTDGDWSFNGNFTGTSTFMSVDGTSAFKGAMNFLCEATPGSSVTRFSVASGGQVVLDGNFQPNGTFTDANSGTLLLVGDQNYFGIAAQRFTAVQHSNPATTGQINLTSGDTIAWRNNGNTADIPLAKNTSDALTYNGNVVATTSGVPWSSVTLSATNTGTGMVLAPTATGTVPFQINAPSGMTVAAFSVAVGPSTPFLVNPGGVVNINNTLFTVGNVNFNGNSLTNAASLGSNVTPGASSGFLRMASTDSIAWRNNANTADIALAKNSSDALTYNGNVIATTSGPVSQPAFAVDLTAQSANCTTQTFTTPSANGYYLVSAYDVITQAATTSSTTPTVNVNYTDADSGSVSSITLISGNSSNAVGSHSISAADSIYAKSGAAITLSCSGYVSSGTTAMQYALHARLQGPF